MSSINGFGTTFYGRKLKGRDGSYVTTKWFIFACIPVVPLQSARLRDLRRGISLQKYEVIEDLPIDRVQVFNTYLYVSVLIPLWLYRQGVKIPQPPSFILDRVALLYIFWSTILLVLLPFVLRLFSKQTTRRGRPVGR